MAKAEAIFQPFPKLVSHQQYIAGLFPISGVTKIWLSSGFANSAGVSALKEALSKHKSVTTCFVGVRNGISTVQGLTALLDTGVTLYVVDTGTPYRIFHPKFYAVVTTSQAQVVIGSSNITFGGLYNNIEASAHLTLKLSEASDAAFLSGLIDPLIDLIKNHSSNCYKIAKASQVDQLRADGVVEDEDAPKERRPVGIAGKGAKSGSIPLISLSFKVPPKKGKTSLPTIPSSTVAFNTNTKLLTYGHLVWTKPKLPRSDLQFPGSNGNATGVLRLTQAKFVVGTSVINQTTYFRDNVFGKLHWEKTATGKEVSSFNVALVIAGVLVGTFKLPLSHNSAWESDQGNYTTAIHWNNAVEHIKHIALVGRTLNLYAPSATSAPYVIEID